jgi:predicted GNAT superfamily acetyltransferase
LDFWIREYKGCLNVNTEERIKELEAKVKELEEKNNTNTATIATMNYTIGLMLKAIENNANLIGQLTTITEKLVY